MEGHKQITGGSHITLTLPEHISKVLGRLSEYLSFSFPKNNEVNEQICADW